MNDSTNLKKTKSVRIEVFPALCGDCIAITFGSEDQRNHIIIDTGYAKTYPKTLGPYIDDISDQNENIDLFVITHTDRDHIGGIDQFIEDHGDEKKLVKTFWFNWSRYYIPVVVKPSDKISIRDGMELRDYLQEIQAMDEKNIVEGEKLDVGEAIIKVLSPNREAFEKFKINWGKKEKLILEEAKGKISSKSKEDDYDKDFKFLLANPFVEDQTIENGSSIAFLFQIRDFGALFLADAHPSVVAKALENMGYTSSNRLEVNYVKISHHGSKKNTSNAILKLIDCQNFIISADGENNHKLPHKETLARIVNHYNNRIPQIQPVFWFNYDNEVLRSIFKECDYKGYKFRCRFLNPNEESLVIEHDML